MDHPAMQVWIGWAPKYHRQPSPLCCSIPIIVNTRTGNQYRVSPPPQFGPDFMPCPTLHQQQRLCIYLARQWRREYRALYSPQTLSHPHWSGGSFGDQAINRKNTLANKLPPPQVERHRYRPSTTNINYNSFPP